MGIKAEELQVSVLETAPSSASFDEIIQIESAWKEKLGARVIGLNVN